VDAGALCLSSSGYDHSASQNPCESHCEEDKHKAPTPLHIHPLSLQDGADTFYHYPIRLSKFIRMRSRILSGQRSSRSSIPPPITNDLPCAVLIDYMTALTFYSSAGTLDLATER